MYFLAAGNVEIFISKSNIVLSTLEVTENFGSIISFITERLAFWRIFILHRKIKNSSSS